MEDVDLSQEELDWLKNHTPQEGLLLHSNEIGDTIAEEVEVLEVELKTING